MKLPQSLNRFFDLPRWQKRAVMILMDLTLIPFALWLAFALRHSSLTPELNDGTWLLIIAPLISIPVFARFGLYRAIMRFLGHQAINAAFKGTLISALVMVLATTLFNLEGIPRSIYIIYFGTAFLLLGGTRHLIRRYYQLTQNNEQRINVAIYGAGASGAQLAQALFNSPEYRPVLFVDDRNALQKAFVHSLNVHKPEELPVLIQRHQLKQILLAIPSASMETRQNILQKLVPLPIHVRSIPGLAELIAGTSIAEIREITIDELLGRPPVAPEQNLLEHCITHKNVMVTGAGGSIGSELCRQIIRLRPNKLVLFEISEFALYQIEQELNTQAKEQQTPAPAIIPVIGSVQNQALLQATLKRHTIQTLYHAAAYKHVPLVEHNPIEGIRNNVFGTWYTADAAYKAGIEHFILISTDKAVRPTNVMGASKRMAELGLQALQARAQQTDTTTFSMVRFGNVLGSSGSVVPLFRQQIRNGGPITVTHRDIIRYFMTIPEAAQLVIQAGSMAEGGEVFLLDMGKPVKIVDLARRMINLSGLSEKTPDYPDGNIEIQFSGLRPGEKLYEELLISSDAAAPTQHPRIFQALEESITYPQYQTVLDQLEQACQYHNMNAIHQLLATYVSGYQHAALQEKKVIELPLDNSGLRLASDNG